jgi:ATP-dependent helicase/nuclease subunit A
MREPADAKARKLIAEALDRSILVEAGAGSGKTTGLVQRMVALIAQGNCTADRIAAVTFTRKAASELKGRFQIALEQAIPKETNSARLGRLQAALLSLDLFFAGTIHSFCARLLRERPIEARLDPNFTELEEDENLLLQDSCWVEYLEELHLSEGPILGQLAELGIEPAGLSGTYQNLCLYPEVEVVRQGPDRPDFVAERQALDRYLSQAWPALPGKVPDKGWDPLQRLLRQAWLRIRHLDTNEDRYFVKVLSGLDKSAKVTQNRWPSSVLAKEQQALFDTFRDAVVRPALERWREYCHDAIMELVIPAVGSFRKARRERSLMNFQDLLLTAAELLRENPEVREYFQKLFTHILVDEFQDTDPIQAEVLLYLCGESLTERSWQKTKVRPASLFIVGDPKQSIYRFRRADIGIYTQVKQIVETSGGLILSLTTNFRSLPAVCAWINPIFKNKFPEQATLFQPMFERLDPFRQSKEGGLRCITVEASRHVQAEIAAADAGRIASWIVWALEGNYKIVRSEEEIAEGGDTQAEPGDIMILLRYRAQLLLYARALERRGIPYEISGDRAFNESEELRNLINLLKTVAEPEDQVALLATLRGPFFGVSDDMLYRFKRSGGSFSYLRPQNQCADAEAKQRMERIFSQLFEFHGWTRTKPAASALSLMLDYLGILPLAYTKEFGESRSGNILKALELALFWSAKKGSSFNDVVTTLSRYYAELEVEEMSIEPGRKNVVRLMNLHKAKGLEASVVFLADPLKDADHPPDLHIGRSEGGAVGYFVASRSSGKFTTEIVGVPPQWAMHQELEARYRQAEQERLLYVATTRAKQLLVVSRDLKAPSRGAWSDLYPYLNDVPELEQPPEEELPALSTENITCEAFVEGKTRRSEQLERCRQASYRVEAVTGLTEAMAEIKPFSGDTEAGRKVGSVVHKMLEILTRDQGTDINALAEGVLQQHDLPDSEKERVISMVTKAVSSDLWARMKKADLLLVEVPFSLKAEGEPLPLIVSGIIDVAFREPDGWVIVDYKTNSIDENMDALVSYYRPQIQMYRRFWQEISGEKVKEAGLYLVNRGKWVLISCS